MSPVPPWYSHTYLSLTGCSQVFSLASSLPVFFSLPLSSPFCLFPLSPPPSSPSVFGPGCLAGSLHLFRIYGSEPSMPGEMVHLATFVPL